MWGLKQCGKQAKLCISWGKRALLATGGPDPLQREERGIGRLVCCVGAPWACTCVTFSQKNQALTAPERNLARRPCTYATWIQRSYYLQAGTSRRAITWAVVKRRRLCQGCCLAPSMGRGCSWWKGTRGPCQPGRPPGRERSQSWGSPKVVCGCFFFFFKLTKSLGTAYSASSYQSFWAFSFFFFFSQMLPRLKAVAEESILWLPSVAPRARSAKGDVASSSLCRCLRAIAKPPWSQAPHSVDFSED